MYSCLYTAHQRNRAVLLLVVEEERPVRKPADKVIAPVLLDNPVLSHVDIIPKTRLLYPSFPVPINRVERHLGLDDAVRPRVDAHDAYGIVGKRR